MAKKKNEEVLNEEIQNEEACEETAEGEVVENESQKALDELNDKYLRLVAEYDNYRKRTAKEKESIYPEAKVSVVSQVLPVLDNLERALAASQSEDPLYEGVKMISKQFYEVLKSIGVEEIKTVGEKFDPNFHNAVMHIDDEAYGENEIVEEFQKGFKIGDRIVRYSMVKVAN